MKKTITLVFAFIFSICANAKPLGDSITIQKTYLSEFVKNWVGVKYVRGGITKYGVDCSGFSKVLYDSVYNTSIPRTAKSQYAFTKRINKNDLIEGDLVFFRTKSRSGWHVGVYLFDGFFVHSENRRSGVKISNLGNSYYKKTYVGAGRIKDSEHTTEDTVLHNQFRDYVEWLINNTN